MVTSTEQAYGTQEHYIDGAFRASAAAETFESLNPATNEVLALAAAGQAEDVDLAVAAARRAFDEGPWPRLKAAERAAALRRIAAGIRARTDEFIAREVADIGMPIAQMKGLAARAAQNFEYYAGVVTELHGRSFQVGDEFLNYTIRKPVGVAGLIMPWNAPLMLSTWRIAPALAAGNTIVLKPAEWSPLTATLLAERDRGGRAPGGRVQRRAGLRGDGGRGAVRAPGGRPHLLHRRDHHRPDDHRRRRADAEAVLDRARRQVAGGRVRGRRSRAVRRRRAGPDLHDERAALHRRLAAAGAGGRSTSGSWPTWPSARGTSASATPPTRAPSSGR